VVACTPHTGLGTVTVERPAYVQVVNLATCKQSRAPKPHATTAVTVRVTPTSQSIVYQGRVVLTIRESHKRVPAGAPGPIELFGLSPDREWVLYAIDPQGSASLAADGLALRAIRVTGGRSFPVAFGLAYDDYRAWCDGKLVITAGGDRYAAHDKTLVVTGPPLWRARSVVTARDFAFGSVACLGNGVVVQASRNGLNAFPRWSLWRLGLDGGMSMLDKPPPGYSDDSPRVSRSGTIYFVRSRRSHGQLYALSAGRVTGPLLSLGALTAYYGHESWPYSVRR
jgi:hypothetical protein